MQNLVLKIKKKRLLSQVQKSICLFMILNQINLTKFLVIYSQVDLINKLVNLLYHQNIFLSILNQVMFWFYQPRQNNFFSNSKWMKIVNLSHFHLIINFFFLQAKVKSINGILIKDQFLMFLKIKDRLLIPKFKFHLIQDTWLPLLLKELFLYITMIYLLILFQLNLLKKSKILLLLLINFNLTLSLKYLLSQVNGKKILLDLCIYQAVPYFKIGLTLKLTSNLLLLRHLALIVNILLLEMMLDL